MEIERKFLVELIPENLYEFPKNNITQGYINQSPVIRVRRSGKIHYLTCKGKGTLVREEWEIKISEEEYNNLWKKIEYNPIRKTRFYITIHDDYIAELDLYYDNLEGLLTVEVEFDNVEEAKKFNPPIWFGKELTEDTRYTNANLSKIGADNDKFWNN